MHTKRIFLAAATALTVLCGGSAAMAETIVSISFDGLCDGMDISANKFNRTALETGNGCDLGANFGAGTIAVIKGRGKVITFAVNLSGKGGSAYQYVYIVDYPLVTGGSWTNFYTTDGKTMGKMGGGTYTVSDGTPRKTSGPKSSTEQP